MKKEMRSLNFKWNPFTLKGEAPASIRFFPDDPLGEVEFASKEDLAIINANPELQKIHKAMLAGVQKKFQSYNEERKTLQAQLDRITTQATQLDEGLAEWEDWAAKNEELLARMISSDSISDTGKERGRMKSNQQDDDSRYNKLLEEINRGAQQMMGQFEGKITHLNRMLKLSMQLNDLYRKNPNLDPDKVLDIALKKGYTDLNKAYEDREAYGEELFDKEVETRLKPRLEEEIAKRNTNIESGSGAVPLNFELPKELPKSFEDAGQRFLADREKEAAKP